LENIINSDSRLKKKLLVFFNRFVSKLKKVLVGIFSIEFFIEREPHSQPEISEREIEGESGRRGENRRKRQVVTFLSRD
jgi:hypothetical protein